LPSSWVSVRRPCAIGNKEDENRKGLHGFSFVSPQGTQKPCSILSRLNSAKQRSNRQQQRQSPYLGIASFFCIQRFQRTRFRSQLRRSNPNSTTTCSSVLARQLRCPSFRHPRAPTVPNQVVDQAPPPNRNRLQPTELFTNTRGHRLRLISPETINSARHCRSLAPRTAASSKV
jgi:hypothetical protein